MSDTRYIVIPHVVTDARRASGRLCHCDDTLSDLLYLAVNREVEQSKEPASFTVIEPTSFTVIEPTPR